VHAQLLGLLLYGTPALLLRATAAFGGGSADAAAAAAALPGPHPALRVLAALDAGATFSVLAEVRLTLDKPCSRGMYPVMVSTGLARPVMPTEHHN
jgi:hypothetical protein